MLKIKMIEISKIVLPLRPSRTYCKGCSPAFEDLVNLIETIGVVYAIEVKDIGHGKYKLLDGFLRVQACRRLGLTEIPAYIIDIPHVAISLLNGRVKLVKICKSKDEAIEEATKIAERWPISYLGESTARHCLRRKGLYFKCYSETGDYYSAQVKEVK